MWFYQTQCSQLQSTGICEQKDQAFLHFAGHKVTFNLPATTSTYCGEGAGSGDTALASPLAAGAPGTPESPFSPEIQHIMDDGGGLAPGADRAG